MTAVAVRAGKNEYKGVEFKLERREFWSPNTRGGTRVVWCWEILSGPGRGDYGGKCATKREAESVVKRSIRGYAKEEVNRHGV